MNKFIMCIVPHWGIPSHTCMKHFVGLLHLVWENAPCSSTAGPNSSYFTKIFLEGVPWDISKQTLGQVCSFVNTMSCF